MNIDAKKSKGVKFRACSVIAGIHEAMIDNLKSAGDTIKIISVIDLFGDDVAIDQIRAGISKSASMEGFKVVTKKEKGSLALVVRRVN